MDKLVIAVIPATIIELIWSKVEALIESVAEKAPDDVVTSIIKDELLAGNKLLLMAAKGANVIGVGVLEVRVLDSGVRTLYIPIIAGSEMDEWMDKGFEVIEQIAKDYNCTELRGLAVRKGWLRKLESYGWEVAYTTLRCKIGE